MHHDTASTAHTPLATPTGPAHDATPESSTCGGCSTRRSFLKNTATLTASLAALTALGPMRTIEALAAPDRSTMLGGAQLLKYPLPTADSVSIDSTNEVIICRSNGEVFAFALSCPHQNTALRTLPRNGGFQCTKHKSKYQPNGTFTSGRATRNMDRFQISRDGDVLVVDSAVVFESDTEAAKWQAALVRV